MITASSIARRRHCPSSDVLSRAETHSVWAEAGHDEHEDLSHLDSLPENLARLVPAGSRSEVKLAYDVVNRTGRIIGEGSDRDYGSPAPFEIVGSADVIGVIDGVVVVVDWKTGFADVAPAASNDQLWFYALAACRALGCDSAIVRIVYTKTGRVDEHEIGPLELAEYADTLEALHLQVAARHKAKAAGELLSTSEGEWCKHCPSKHVCPSKHALLVQVATKGLAVIGDSTMTTERAAAAYQQIVHVEQLAKDARKRLDAYVTETGPIDLGDGRSYGRYQRDGNEKLDGAVTAQAIRDVVGESAKEFESIAIERKTSKAAIDRAAKALVVKGAAKVAASVIKRVRELGGAKRSTEYPIGEYLRDKHDAADAIDVGAVNAMLETA